MNYAGMGPQKRSESPKKSEPPEPKSNTSNLNRNLSKMVTSFLLNSFSKPPFSTHLPQKSLKPLPCIGHNKPNIQPAKIDPNP